MKTFLVCWTEETSYYCNVDAENEEEAKKLFWEGETRGVTENGSSIIESSLEINEDKE